MPIKRHSPQPAAGPAPTQALERPHDRSHRAGDKHIWFEPTPGEGRWRVQIRRNGRTHARRFAVTTHGSVDSAHAAENRIGLAKVGLAGSLAIAFSSSTSITRMSAPPDLDDPISFSVHAHILVAAVGLEHVDDITDDLQRGLGRLA